MLTELGDLIGVNPWSENDGYACSNEERNITLAAIMICRIAWELWLRSLALIRNRRINAGFFNYSGHLAVLNSAFPTCGGIRAGGRLL